MKQSRLGVICCIIALLIHLILLFILFVVWIKQRSAEHAQRETQMLISPDAGRPGAQVVMYHPPAQTSSSSAAQVSQPMPPQIVQPVHISEPAAPQSEMQPPVTYQKPAQPEMTVSKEVYTPSIKEATRDAATPIKKISKSQKAAKKKQEALQGLKGLSFADLGHQSSTLPPSGTRGQAGNPTDAHDIAYRLYAAKVIQTLGNAINAEGVRLLLNHNIIRFTTLFVKIKKDGTLLDIYLEPALPELKKIEQAIKSVAHNTGLYPRIPETLKADPITISIPLQIDGKEGDGDYRFTYARY